MKFRGSPRKRRVGPNSGKPGNYNPLAYSEKNRNALQHAVFWFYGAL